MSEPAAHDGPLDLHPETPAERSVPVLLLALVMIFLSVAMGTMVNVALPWITEWSGAEPASAGWVVSGYLLTFGAFNVVHGRLSDRYGIRRIYLVGMVIFGLGGLASAAAPSLGALVAVRVLQGVGAAAVPALGVTMIGRLLAPEERGAAMGMVMATVGVSATVAPFLGGLLVESFSWRAVFLVPSLALVLAPVAWRVMPASLDDYVDAEPFDLVGACLVVLAAGCLLVASDLVRRDPFGSTTVLLLVGSPVLFGTAWLWFQRRDSPFLPPALLRLRPYRGLLQVGAAANGLRFGTVVLVPLFLRECFDASALVIGASLVPGAVMLALTGRAAGRQATLRGTRFMATLGLFGLIGATLLTAALVGRGAWGMGLGMSAFGLAFAAAQPSLLTGLSQVLRSELHAVGNGLYFMVFFLGAALGVAVAMGALSVQPAGMAPVVDLSWLLGTLPEGGGRYVNAMLLLAVVGVGGLPGLRVLPSGTQRS